MINDILLGTLILAGGKGTRMHSNAPKVLQPILEEPMLRYVYDAVTPLCENIWTIVGHESTQVCDMFPFFAERAIIQMPQLGTGHALQVAWPIIKDSKITHLLIINGDTPQLETDTLQKFVMSCLYESNQGQDFAFISNQLNNPGNFGRVLRKNGKVISIIEAKEDRLANPSKDLREVNAGIYCLNVSIIDKLLPFLSNDNNSKEFYITDLVQLANEQNFLVEAYPLMSDSRFMGVNTPYELIQAEEYIREKIVHHWLNNGVIIHNPQTVRIGPDAFLEKGVRITGPCEIYGKSTLSQGVTVDSHCKIINSTIQENSYIQSFSFLMEANIAPQCSVGPYARLRPGSELKNNSHIGNFVEIKKSTVGAGSKVNHLTYIGDTTIGKNVNIGAGTITCNYDGINKHQTIIEDKAFIGSNSSLVAPVTIGARALIGAGSVITKDIPDDTIGITRAKQNIIYRK